MFETHAPDPLKFTLITNRRKTESRFEQNVKFLRRIFLHIVKGKEIHQFERIFQNYDFSNVS